MEFKDNQNNFEKTTKNNLVSDQNLNEINEKKRLVLSFKNEENLYSDNRTLQDNFKDFLKMRKVLYFIKFSEMKINDRIYEKRK
jgi:hypothetical protein